MRRHEISLSDAELVSLYLLLSRDEQALDERQQGVLRTVSDVLYRTRSVSEMEDIANHYRSILRDA